ncbi:MAG: PilZ domain-containing protein [Gammaproteobacteria bacterium]
MNTTASASYDPMRGDRRLTYRYTPTLLLEPQVHVVHGDTRLPAIDVVDITARGARLGFALSRRPAFRPGEDVRVVAQAPGLDGPVDIPARVVFCATADERVVAGLVFDLLPDVGERADGVFFSVFNRRMATRTGRAAATVIARLTVPVLADPLEVINHSARGIGFLVDGALDRQLRDLDQVELALSLPGDTAPHPVTAEIRHRACRSDTVYYGCRFADAAA